MPVHSLERKLAGILGADVVGYSRLMGEDEAGTLARLKEHRRELIDPKHADVHNNFNVQRDLVSRSTLQIFRAESAEQWQDAILRHEHGTLLYIRFARDKLI